MNKREKILAGAVGAVVVFVGGQWAFDQLLQAPLNEKRREITRLEEELQRQETTIRNSRVAAEQLHRWQEQSLPTDPARARSAYNQWLLELTMEANFSKRYVDPGEISSKSGVYMRIPFTVRGQGTLQQLTKFLYGFYQADHLHQILGLRLRPISGSDEMDISMSIEALVLPGGERADVLTTRKSDRLRGNPLAAYTPISQRNLFGTGGASSFDVADHTFLSAIVDADGTLEAWLTLRTTGEMLRLRRGEEFEVGQFRGSIAQILPQDVVIDSESERWLITLGENLSQATALPPEF